MNSETFGMFGPKGLLAKIIKAEDEDSGRVNQSLKKVPEDTVDQSISDGMPVFQQDQKSCETFNQVSNAVEDLDITSEANVPIKFVPLCDLPLVEAALSIEKIQNTIFSMLDPVDLLRCRLVSSSWLRMATNEKLLKWEQNQIRIFRNLKNSDYHAFGRWGKTGKRPLKDLTDVLNGVGSHTFPCSAFEIRGMAISQSDFLMFVDRYGFSVNYFEISYPLSNSEESDSISYEKDSLLEFLTKLLTEQMPNLETFKIQFFQKTQFTGEVEPQLLVSIKEGLYFGGKRNQNLRTVEFRSYASYEIIEAVCCLAPKLKKLTVEDLGFWVENKHRLHLLKEIKFNSKTEDSTIEAIIGAEDKTELQKLAVFFTSDGTRPVISPSQPELLKRIFDFCCESLEELHLSPFSFLPGQVLPRMLKVKLLVVVSYGKVRNSDNREFFPPGTSIVTTFPNLHKIRFILASINIQRSFVSLCTNEKVTSVKKIDAYGYGFDETVLQKQFPNAVITKRD